jgi:hypothetical protein
VRFDADAAEIEAVGVPAGRHGPLRHRPAFGVSAAGLDQQIEFRRLEDEKSPVKPFREFRGAMAVVSVVSIMPPPGVMKKGEQRDDAGIRPSVAGEHQAVPAHARPVPDAMDAVPVEGELLPQVRNQFPCDQALH